MLSSGVDLDEQPALPLNPCQWEPAFYATASAAAHGWAAYRGSGPPRPKTIRHCNFCGSTAHLMRGSVLDTYRPGSLRNVRTDCAYWSSACCLFPEAQGPTHCTYTPSAHQPRACCTHRVPWHHRRGCTMGSSLAREQQFLRCGTTLPLPCFVRRFVVPLHRARADFALDDLREGRIDLAARHLANPIGDPP